MARRNQKPKPKKKPTNSKIAEAQRAAVERRLERDAQRVQASAQNKRQGDDAKLKEAQKFVDPRESRPPVLEQKTKPNRTATAGDEIAGLALSFGLPNQLPKKPLADPALYGNSAANRQARLNAMKEAADKQNNAALTKAEKAVYMGPGKLKMRTPGPRRFDDNSPDGTEMVTAGDDVQNADELMAWLADPQKFEEIKAVANKSGLNVQSYEDVAKLWESVVKQAAVTFSRTQKKVTPWALIAMRGKYVGPDGRMQDRVTTSTSIEEMDPAEARNMFSQTAQQYLGRAPSKIELDDFISKAQMIARNNPAITTTRSQVGFDGEVEQGTTTSVTKGGQSVVNAQAGEAAQEMAKQDEDYGAYQAAGVYFPLLFDALNSPV